MGINDISFFLNGFTGELDLKRYAILVLRQSLADF